MRVWARSDRVQFCGLCRAVIAMGDAVQLVQVTHMSRKLVRCGHCADGEVPPELPVWMEPVPLPPMPLVRFSPELLLPLDFKQRQMAPDREPGSDG